MLPWRTLDTVSTDEGELELRVHGERDYMIAIDGRVLMVSRSSRSEEALARLACQGLGGQAPRVLIGGLGMGFTLRAALDELPPGARVTVCEITPAVLRWCRGPLAHLTAAAVDDPRVTVVLEDVARVIGRAARGGRSYDAIVLDLYEGPNARRSGGERELYGARALARARRALRPGGVLAVWSEASDAAFERRLQGAGFATERRRLDGGGHRYVVYLAR
jgi:spermidine synthase